MPATVPATAPEAGTLSLWVPMDRSLRRAANNDPLANKTIQPRIQRIYANGNRIGGTLLVHLLVHSCLPRNVLRIPRTMIGTVDLYSSGGAVAENGDGTGAVVPPR